ncbi:flagella synthesis protein FlgN [Marinomonas sp. 2405UD68-3]|uniref:flagella synthesis protein FlgN n=1 Tax=Marinomonas sp. 2405UD68-3 TaxID=3391835 RepID=UPI0039C9A97C
MVPVEPIFARNKELLDSLSTLLDNERDALAKLSSEAILEIAAQKRAILDELDALNTKRHSLLIKFGIINQKQPEEGQFKEWLHTQHKDVKLIELVSLCEKLLETCKEKNHTNEQILNIAQKRNKSFLEILKGSDKKSRIYTAKGSTRPINSKHTIGKA